MSRLPRVILAGSMVAFSAIVGFSPPGTATEEPTSTTEVETRLSPLEGIWPVGEVREYIFYIAGQEVGRQWNQLAEGTSEDSARTFRLEFRLNLDLSEAGNPIKLLMNGSLTLEPDGRPVAYHLDVTVDGQKQKLEAVFAGDTVEATVLKGERESLHSLPCSPDISVVDNNMIGQWGLMLGMLPLGAAEEIQQQIFVPQALMEMAILVRVQGMETVSVCGAQENAYVCRILPLEEICWVTEDGKLIRLEDSKQNLVVTLLSPGGDVAPPESSGDGFF